MKYPVFCGPGDTPANRYALQMLGASYTPNRRVTHLLLSIPTRDEGQYDDLLDQLPKDIVIVGGFPEKDSFPGYRKCNLLDDPVFTAENAAITAHCALQIAIAHLPRTLDGCPVLIIGWGRIGKCLAPLLRSLGAKVSIYARKESDRAMILALGYEWDLSKKLGSYRVIFNTAPAGVLSREMASRCRDDCVKIELASIQGLPGDDVIMARGLPGKNAPESAGILIAKTVTRLMEEDKL